MIDNTWYVRAPGSLDATSAGGVVVISGCNSPRVALVCEDGHPYHVIPKGTVEPGERLEDTARREIAEEAGITDALLIRKLDALTRMNWERTKWKTIHYFLFVARHERTNPIQDPRHFDFGWFSLDDLPTMFWPEQRELLLRNRVAMEEALRNDL